MRKLITIIITLATLLTISSCSSNKVEIYDRLSKAAADYYEINDADAAIAYLTADLEQQVEERKITPKPTVAPTITPTAIPADVEEVEEEATYILNKNSKKFHYPYCDSVADMALKNKLVYTGSREEVINMGYVPCQRCQP